MFGALEGEDDVALGGRLRYLVWRWYGLPADVAEDVAQSACATALEVADRYPRPDEHPRILVGILRNKCREYMARSTRRAKALEGMRAAAAPTAAGTRGPRLPAAVADGVLGELTRREDGAAILEALGQVRPQAREVFRQIAEEGATRKQLIRRYRLNANTFDSRLRAYRGELRRKLATRGVGA